MKGRPDFDNICERKEDETRRKNPLAVAMMQ